MRKVSLILIRDRNTPTGCQHALWEDVPGIDLRARGMGDKEKACVWGSDHDDTRGVVPGTSTTVAVMPLKKFFYRLFF